MDRVLNMTAFGIRLLMVGIIALILDVGLGFWYNRKTGKIGLKWHIALFVIYFTLCSLVKYNIACLVITCVFSAFLDYYVIDQFLLKNNRRYLKYGYLRMWLGITVIAVMELGLYCLLGDLFLAIAIISTVYYLIGIIDYLVVQVRGADIEATDLQVLPTAIAVAGRYHYSINAELILSVIAGITHMIMFRQMMYSSKIIISGTDRIVIGLVLIFIIAGIYFSPLLHMLRISEEEQSGDSLLLHWLLYWYEIRLDKGITEQEKNRAEIIIKNETELLDTSASQSARKPNILVIMNESFSDLRNWGDHITTNFPIYDALDVKLKRSEIMEMKAVSSVWGGRTVCSEAEFLTGIPSRFANRLPYSSFYIKNEHQQKKSILSGLKTAGYTTMALHSYKTDMYRRPIVYPALGFEQMCFIDSFGKYETYGNFCSDRSHYKKSWEMLSNKCSNQPQFQFNITMQNHGGYSDQIFNSDVVRLKNRDEIRFKEANNYLTLVAESSRAICEYMDILDSFDEPTLMVFFGDHQPKLPIEFMDVLTEGKYSQENLKDSILQYIVPLYFWGNKAFHTYGDLRGIKNRQGTMISFNYIPLLLFDICGIKDDAFRRISRKMLESYPVITQNHIIDGSGNFASLSDIDTGYQNVCKYYLYT